MKKKEIEEMLEFHDAESMNWAEVNINGDDEYLELLSKCLNAPSNINKIKYELRKRKIQRLALKNNVEQNEL